MKKKLLMITLSLSMLFTIQIFCEENSSTSEDILFSVRSNYADPGH